MVQRTNAASGGRESAGAMKGEVVRSIRTGSTIASRPSTKGGLFRARYPSAGEFGWEAEVSDDQQFAQLLETHSEEFWFQSRVNFFEASVNIKLYVYSIRAPQIWPCPLTIPVMQESISNISIA